MKKFFVAFFFALFSLFAYSPSAYSQENFQTDVKVEYKVNDNGPTFITHAVTLTNLTTNYYASSYNLTLDNIELINPKAYEGGKELAISQRAEGDKNVVQINFGEPLVGKGKSRTFSLTFENSDFAVLSGEVWEISIPRLANESLFNSYVVIISIPASFGQEAYVSPNPFDIRSEGERLIYYFDKSTVAKTGVTAGFGKFQVFSFNLTYHLENPLARRVAIDIAIPPDTALQRMHYQILEPSPANVFVDEDGNWIATYTLESRQQLDIKVAGAVQIFAGPRPFAKTKGETLTKNLQDAKYWEVSDPEIVALAKRLKTPRAIYDYVSQNLTYDYDRVKPNVTRLGAKQALENPKSAICMEFTDLFVALARAAGIPAREINGYAYTENPEIQPLSLVADVLHSWPEYWDATRGAWIAVDPTWGSTTGGIDFFNKLDLRHFAFVIHGTDSEKPYPPGSYKLGPNPQKDVFVNFGQLPNAEESEPEITISQKASLPFMPGSMKVAVKNSGQSALYNLALFVFFDGKSSPSETIEVLPPYGIFEKELTVPYSILGKDTPSTVKVSVLAKTASAPTFKNRVIIESLLAIFILISVLIFLIFLRYKRIKIKTFLKSKINEGQIPKPGENPNNKEGI